MISIQNSFFLLLILLISLSANQVYAESNPNYDVSWKIIFLNDDFECKLSEKNRVNEIIDLTQQYFELYNFANQMVEPVCVFSSQYSVDLLPNPTDLNILVFDEKIGADIFVKYGYEGLYAHFGLDRSKNHVIMVMEPPRFSSAYEFTESSWNLSHQLSHFILSYYGHNLESIERLLHSHELDYEDCSNKIGNEKCNQIKSLIHSEITGNSMPIVAPLNDIVNQNFIQYPPNDLYSAHVVKELQRQITIWWLNGIIDDESYLDTVKEIMDVSVIGDKTIYTDQLSISDGFSIIDKTLKNKNTEPSNGLVMPVEHKIYDSLTYAPFDTTLMSFDSSDSVIPDWFKNRAKICTDLKLGDRVFFDGLNALVSNGYIQDK